MSLFAKDPTVKPITFPPCPICEGQGFVGCPEAINGTEVLIVIAWRLGLPCVCPAGRAFGRDQAKWIELERSPSNLKADAPVAISFNPRYAPDATYDPEWWRLAVQDAINKKRKLLKASEVVIDERASD